MGYKALLFKLIDSKKLSSFLQECKNINEENLAKSIAEFFDENVFSITTKDVKNIQKRMMSDFLNTYLSSRERSVIKLNTQVGIDRGQLEDYISLRNAPNRKNASLLLNVLEVKPEDKELYRMMEDAVKDLHYILVRSLFDLVFTEVSVTPETCQEIIRKYY